MLSLNIVLAFIYFLLIITILSYVIPHALIFFKNVSNWWVVLCFLIIFLVGLILLSGNIIYWFIYCFIASILCFIFEAIWKNKDLSIALRRFRSVSIPLLILLIGYLGIKLVIRQFNSNNWWITEKTRIPTKIDDWGDLATCFTALFALISIFFAYRAFLSQANSSKRTSFDATFTQMFAQHNVLRKRVVGHNIGVGMDIFQYCVNHFCNEFKSPETPSTPSVDEDISSLWKRLKKICFKLYNEIKFKFIPNEFKSSEKSATASKNKDISTLWDDFNKEDNIKDVSVDFKNYFKYIYHEINIIVCQQDEVLNDNAKQNYVQLIQAQMNYDELLCYFINQVEYLNYWKSKNKDIYERAETYAKSLKDYAFFRELCESRSGYVDLVKKIKEKNSEEVLKLIDEKWLS